MNVTPTLARRLRFRPRDPGTWVRRATRSTVHVPLAYRAVNRDDWHRGELVNISRTGALFVASRSLQPEPHAALIVFLSRAALNTAIDGTGAWPDGYTRARVIRSKQLTKGTPVVAIRFDAEWSDRPPDAHGDEPMT